MNQRINELSFLIIWLINQWITCKYINVCATSEWAKKITLNCLKLLKPERNLKPALAGETLKPVLSNRLQMLF